jgi:tRNA(Ile2) C34 agmatinyltransferase TiaS
MEEDGLTVVQQPRCPDCGTVMDDIAGGYECPGCGQIELTPAEWTVRPSFEGGSLPGF